MNKQQYGKLQLKKDLSDRKTVMIKCLQKFQNVKSVLNCVYISLVFCYFKWGASLYLTLYLTHIVSLHQCFLDLPAWKYLLSLSFCFVLFDILLRYWLNLAFELQAQAVEAGGLLCQTSAILLVFCVGIIKVWKWKQRQKLMLIFRDLLGVTF